MRYSYVTVFLASSKLSQVIPPSLGKHQPTQYTDIVFSYYFFPSLQKPKGPAKRKRKIQVFQSVQEFYNCQNVSNFRFAPLYLLLSSFTISLNDKFSCINVPILQYTSLKRLTRWDGNIMQFSIIIGPQDRRKFDNTLIVRRAYNYVMIYLFHN